MVCCFKTRRFYFFFAVLNAKQPHPVLLKFYSASGNKDVEYGQINVSCLFQTCVSRHIYTSISYSRRSSKPPAADLTCISRMPSAPKSGLTRSVCIENVLFGLNIKKRAWRLPDPLFDLYLYSDIGLVVYLSSNNSRLPETSMLSARRISPASKPISIIGSL